MHIGWFLNGRTQSPNSLRLRPGRTIPAGFPAPRTPPLLTTGRDLTFPTPLFGGREVLTGRRLPGGMRLSGAAIAGRSVRGITGRIAYSNGRGNGFLAA